MNKVCEFIVFYQNKKRFVVFLIESKYLIVLKKVLKSVFDFHFSIDLIFMIFCFRKKKNKYELYIR